MSKPILRVPASAALLAAAPFLLPLVPARANLDDAASPSVADVSFEKRTIDLDTGITLAYVELGPEDGDAVVFLHGITDTSRTFFGTLHRLAALRPDLRLLALDLRGHGASSMPDPRRCARAPENCFRVEDLAADVLAFLDARGIERAALVGHSLGSLVAQEIALRHPDRATRLVLIGSAASVVDHPAMKDLLLAGLVEGSWQQALEARGIRFPEEAYQLTPLDADPDAEQWLLANWVTEAPADPELLAAIVHETARTRIGTWLGAARAVQRFDTRERLRRLTVPTFVVWPVQDVLFPEEPAQRELLAALESASRDCGTRFVWKQYGRAPLPASGLPETDVGHNAPWGVADALANDLAAFLREGGEPTRDLPYADPNDVPRMLVEPGAARILEGGRAGVSSSACREASHAAAGAPRGATREDA